ncbi:NFX1-type zinc finger-containing protein 1 isoform X2 [Daphnia magna]|nr:NFX1-type zinc finger-containing protein 1 isoform X2 [Daphnia magna]
MVWKTSSPKKKAKKRKEKVEKETKLKSTDAVHGPNVSLRQLYNERDKLAPTEMFSRLQKMSACVEEFHPTDMEFIWLILGCLCNRLGDIDLKRMAKMIENKKLYHQFGLCCTNISRLDIDNSGKKLRLEDLFRALCKTTSLYLTVASNVAVAIRPNFFIDLYNTTQGQSMQDLQLHPRIIERLRLIQSMLTGDEMQDDSGIENQDTSCEVTTLASEFSVESLLGEPPDDITDWNIVPSQHDIFWQEQVFLRPNLLRRAYPDLETYRDVQFRLLMEDFMQPLRLGMAKVSSGQIGPRGVQEVRIYNNVTFKRSGLVQDRHLVPERETSWRFYKVSFERLPRVNWITSRRLIHGSLVCLWDGTKEVIVASVANSHPQELASGQVTLALESPDLPINLTEKVYVMLESVVFFEPYRAVLKVLQNFTYDSFPMLDYFLGFEKGQMIPSYLADSPVYILRDNKDSPLRIQTLNLDLATWPSAENLGLDKRQRDALQQALTNRVALIQGPPGTGKTFLALRILRSLLENQNFWQGKKGEIGNLSFKLQLTSEMDWRLRNKIFWKRHGENWQDSRTPVVVICYTNHALDQFLEGILGTTNKIVRIGSQSKSSILEPYSLHQVKSRVMQIQQHGPYSDSNYLYYFYRMKEIRAKMEVQIDVIQCKMSQTQFEILQVAELKRKGVISAEISEVFEHANRRQCKQKRKDNILKWWLGWSNHRQLLKVLREMRMNYRNRSQVAKAVTAMKEESAFEFLPEDIEMPDRIDNDMNEDIVDDEDYPEELRLAREEISSVVLPNPVSDNVDDGEYVPWCQSEEGHEDMEDKIFSNFAQNQMERMQYIRDLLLAMQYETYEPEDFSADEIMTLPLSKRWMLFAQWKRSYQDIVNNDLRDSEIDYEKKIKEYNELKGEALAALCRTADVVGMTTTGAAKNRALLESLKAKIVIVEEAAEVLESHIICSLTADCQHLIMIGDHQQLRPSVNVHQLATKYHLNVSLFERLIMGGMKAVRLGVQHRMRPEIARLIVPAVYAQLENHSSVYGHPHIPGMQNDVFFYHHNHPEKEEGSSFYNLNEVAMALRLALYLMRDKQVSGKRITILATYTAQLHQLLNARKNYKSSALADVRMTVVDNFQGEENDVIILSLVRNNTRNSVGFLRIDNRVCVALSRARNGLYILGNIRMLAMASPLWAHMENVLLEHGEIGEAIPLQCRYHTQTIHKVNRPEDFPVGSFCSEICAVELPCGHGCRLTCHADGPHTRSCLEKVEKKLNCGHSQSIACSTNILEVACHERVPVIMKPCMHEHYVMCSKKTTSVSGFPCPVLVQKLLPCGHSQQIPCSMPPDDSLCKTEIEHRFMCSHTAKIPCYQSKIHPFLLEFSCKEMVCKKLLCGHSKWMKCSDDPSGYDCGITDERKLDCGHVSEFVCPGKPIVIPCQATVNRRMPCGHKQKGICSKPIERCLQEIVRSLPCGHSIKTVCWNTTPPCTTVVEKMLLCGHMHPVRCSEGIGSIVCNQETEVLHPLCSHVQVVPCSIAKNKFQLCQWKCKAEPLKMLHCGHEIRLPCAQQIDKSITCTALINYTLPCHHMVTIRCREQEIKARDKCKIKCGTPVDCGHYCSLPCHARRTAHACNETVSRQLRCGHTKDMPCFREPSKEICFAPISLKRACGHVLNVVCGEASSLEENICGELIEKRLPCNHLARVACSISAETVFCNARIEQVLGCRHTVPTKCGVPLKKRLALTCNVEEVKELPCGHMYHLKCGSKESNKQLSSLFCRIEVEKVIPKCGHKVKIECGKKLSRNDCTSMCEKKLHCGHRCRLLCREQCATNSCQQEVELEGVPMPCGHGLRGECRLRYADQAVLDAKKLEVGNCTFPCKAKLACGHRCTANCNECRINQFHSACVQRCKKILICGHKCEAQCGKACPPCKKACDYQCSHQKCMEQCSNECVSCMKKCEWECPHEVCDHPCYEFCKRAPCDKPCKKTFRCGHTCNGLCGEICPPKCPSCAYVKIPNYNPKARYIYLECAHYVEVEEMDEWINGNGESEDTVCNIRCPSCPQCRRAIRDCFRYGDKIKEFYVDLISIKWEVAKDDKEVFSYIEKIRKSLTKLKTTEVEFEAQLNSVLIQGVCLRSLSRDQRWDLLYRMQITYLLCYLVKDAKKKYSMDSIEQNKKKDVFVLSDTAVEYVKTRASIGFKYMEKYANSGQGYYLELLSAWKRFDLHRQFFVVDTLSATVPASVRVDQRQLDKASHLLNGNQWTSIEENYLLEWLDRKSKFFSVNLASSVNKTLIQRLNMSSELWMKCTIPSCEAVFCRSRHPQCPECLDQSLA